MALLHYEIDLCNAAEKERNDILALLEHYVYTQLVKNPKAHIYSFFLDDAEDINKIPGLPLALIRRIP